MKQLISLFIIYLFANSVFAQPPNIPAESGAVFGKNVAIENAITSEQLQSLLLTKEGEKEEVTVKGQVSGVCQMEGCWLKIKSADGNNIMVRMRDHAFAVPVAINNKMVVINGVAEEKVTSVEMLKHYAEDAGKTQAEIDAIKEPKKEIIIQAEGIEVI